ncbi:hypothetical protein SAMN02746041_00960 [Desulfacinum hydrothermale DSM 13146]|uniref:Uncharacterized protein n=1 Tax=Desulfacinum hydrothermale DSM 13146 TaxID=1121390 RepID=A0A1W1X9U3_9BACT|nr:hypothetical protein [Desulfacinum hydrothermale]SMC20597.1 hypothetical protein SAMN02746041_00960 [Desulfacinum hydrothermale DSM 13146]
MQMTFQGALYLVAAVVLTGIYLARERGLAKIDRTALPELEPAEVERLKGLLATAYQRTMYLAVSLYYLAFVTLFHRTVQAKWFGMILAVSLFFYNIPPRNRAMRIVTEAGLDWKELNRRHIKL